MVVNKHKDLIVKKYSADDEDERLVRDRSHNLEYLTTMRYIQKFVKPGAKILEIGAATGRYSIALAKMGYNVTAVDLTPKYVEVMKRKARKLKNFQCMVADALDLSMFKDKTFDMVLNLGPMYHLFHEKDKKQAVKETLRVAKKGAVCMFAYISHASMIANYGLRHDNVYTVFAQMDKTGRVRDVPEETIFTSFYVEDFRKLFNRTHSKYITNVATDGIAPMMPDWIDRLSKKAYDAFVQWHFMTCERPDQQGYSSHLLYICKKQ